MAKKKLPSTKKKKTKRQLRQGVDTMDNEKLTELFYENQRNIAVLGRDVESIKQDIKTDIILTINICLNHFRYQIWIFILWKMS